MGRFLDYLGGSNATTRVLVREWQEGQRKIGRCCNAGFEYGRRVHEPKNASGS